jgi:periplasmic protein TonB
MTMLNPDSPLRGIDAKRIAGNSFAIFLHAIALAVLMMPSEAPTNNRVIDEEPFVIFPEKEKPKDEVVKREIVRNEVKPQKITPQRQLIAPSDHPNPIAANQKPSDEGEETELPDIDVPEIGNGLPVMPTGPIGVQLINGPRPAYPRDAKRDGLTGTVILLLQVGLDGRVIDAKVQKSSGHRVLDQAALRHVERTWQFAPATLNGSPVIAEVVLPVEFSLGDF